MKHSLEELLSIVYRHYPRGIGGADQLDDPRIKDTEEHARLVAARKRAAEDPRWPLLRRRVSEHFPEAPLMNHSLHLPTGGLDACYSFTLDLPRIVEPPGLWFQVSFLAPYYIVHSPRRLEVTKRPRDLFSVDLWGTRFSVEQSPFDPAFILDPNDESRRTVTVHAPYVSFDISPEERPYADWIAHAIEDTFGCEIMPPEVGTVAVPEVVTNLRLLGEVKLYDCLFSDNHTWVRPSPSELPTPGARVDPRNLTPPLIGVLTVLAALYHMLLAVTRGAQDSFYAVVITDGFLHQDQARETLATIRRRLWSPPPAGIAHKKELEAITDELEALAAAWEGDRLPASMVAAASRFLDRWTATEEPE